MFKQGDKAVNDLVGVEVEVQFGPVETQAGKTAYLVKDRGQSYLLWEGDLSPAPKFQVGQKVAFQYSRHKEYYEVVAGPFPAIDGALWVLKDQDGVHDTSYEKYMVPVVE